MRYNPFLAALTAVVLTGCATSEVVYLRHGDGRAAQCGPYTDFGNIPSGNLTTQLQVRSCVEDYQRQGYERVPGP